MITFEPNTDGSVIGRLAVPVNVGDDEIGRITIPRLLAKHLIKAPVLGQGAPIGPVIAWAMEVVQPAGAVGELDPADGVAVANKLLEQLGKSPATGVGPSPE